MPRGVDGCGGPALSALHSGTTGKPKGLLHTTGGYSVQTYLTSKYIFDLKDTTCTGARGHSWVTGHSYIVYGPLQNGATVVIYEGAPNWPGMTASGRSSTRKSDCLYTGLQRFAHSEMGGFMGREALARSLRLLGTVATDQPESWMWYHRMTGRERCPIVDTYCRPRRVRS